VQLTSPHGNRAVSLQERQAEMLREKIKALEHRIMDMVRHGNENMVITDRIQRWAQVDAAGAVHARAARHAGRELQIAVQVPQVALQVWEVDARYAASRSRRRERGRQDFASSLTQPYCGVATRARGRPLAGDPDTALSLALIRCARLGRATARPAFGMLVLASPDPQRFESGLATDFLERIAELASAALSRLRPR
jgi:uncharacterized protein YigA (DUF484 family)